MMIDDDPLVYFNSAIIPLSQAMGPVLDRGFIFDDGIYEVIPIYYCKPFRGAQHLAGLFRSLESIGIANPHDTASWNALIDKVVSVNGLADQMVYNQMVYIQVTRGVAKRSHAFPANAVPTVCIMSIHWCRRMPWRAPTAWLA